MHVLDKICWRKEGEEKKTAKSVTLIHYGWCSAAPPAFLRKSYGMKAGGKENGWKWEKRSPKGCGQNHNEELMSAGALRRLTVLLWTSAGRERDLLGDIRGYWRHGDPSSLIIFL